MDWKRARRAIPNEWRVGTAFDWISPRSIINGIQLPHEYMDVMSRQLASNSSREYWISVCVHDTSSCENARFSCSWKILLAAGSSTELKHKSLNNRAERLH